MDRRGFLAVGARGGAAVAMGAAATGVLVERAPAATSLADLDLALARLAVGAEVLAAEFYSQAIAAKKFGEETTKYLRRAHFNEQEHLTAMAGIISGAGQTPSTADDFEITFPDGTFDSRGSIASFGVTLETAFVGAYLGAVEAFSPNGLKSVAARIAASEAQHLSVFTDLGENRPVGISFPAPIDYETASGLLEAYLS